MKYKSEQWEMIDIGYLQQLDVIHPLPRGGIFAFNTIPLAVSTPWSLSPTTDTSFTSMRARFVMCRPVGLLDDDPDVSSMKPTMKQCSLSMLGQLNAGRIIRTALSVLSETKCTPPVLGSPNDVPDKPWTQLPHTPHLERTPNGSIARNPLTRHPFYSCSPPYTNTGCQTAVAPSSPHS